MKSTVVQLSCWPAAPLFVRRFLVKNTNSESGPAERRPASHQTDSYYGLIKGGHFKWTQVNELCMRGHAGEDVRCGGTE